MNMFILKGHEAIMCDNIIEWGMYYKAANRHVDQTEIGEARISTVFLGMDHGFDGQVLLFETMIFGGEHDMYCERYKTWDEAVEGHAKACKMVSLKKSGK